MQMSFYIKRRDESGQWLYSIFMEPTERQTVCEDLPLEAAAAAFAEWCCISQQEAEKEMHADKEWERIRLTARKPVRRLGDLF